MNEAHLALLTKLEELDAYTHTVLHQFPRIERHLLCAGSCSCLLMPMIANVLGTSGG